MSEETTVEIKNIGCIDMTKSQKEKVDTLMWLFDPISYRATGRTRTLAIAYILLALKYQNVPIKLQSHNMNERPRELMQTINNLLEPFNKKIAWTFNLQRSTLTITERNLQWYSEESETWPNKF